MRAFLLAALIPAAVLADQVPRPAAERLVRYVLPPERYAEMMEQMATQALKGLQMQGLKPSADEAKRFHAAMLEAVTYEEMVAISTRIYAAHFTEREIGDILAFYRTETGTKFTRELPAIMGDSMRETAQIVQTRVPALLEKHGLVPKPASQPAPAPEKARDAPKQK